MNVCQSPTLTVTDLIIIIATVIITMATPLTVISTKRNTRKISIIIIMAQMAVMDHMTTVMGTTMVINIAMVIITMITIIIIMDHMMAMITIIIIMDHMMVMITDMTTNMDMTTDMITNMGTTTTTTVMNMAINMGTTIIIMGMTTITTVMGMTTLMGMTMVINMETIIITAMGTIITIMSMDMITDRRIMLLMITGSEISLPQPLIRDLVVLSNVKQCKKMQSRHNMVQFFATTLMSSVGHQEIPSGIREWK